ncbi:MAG: DUF4336 domain-containing protein [Proteobacteria bacterium]|nr:DUF4336 domain-containing protein [Pseudomonadota bacterium]
MARLKHIAEGVWGAETTVSIGMGASLPLRMTVLKDDKGLILIAPIGIDNGLAIELEQIGPVHLLVGPNLLHYRYLEAAKDLYPQARLLGAPGLAEKKPKLRFDGVLTGAALCPAVDMMRIEGAEKLSEVVFVHKSSRTLVVTDLVFNILQASGMSRFVLKTFSGALGKCEQSRLCRMLTNDRDATARSIAQLLSWSFERVVPAHGEVVEANAPKVLEAALWWMRGEARRTAHPTEAGQSSL